MESSVHPSVDFFLGATTPAGFKGYFAPLRREPGMQLVLLKSGPGCGKSTLMKRLARAAQDKGEPIQRIHCASDPDSLDGVVFLRQKRAIIDATAPHVVEPEAPGADERVLSLYHTIDADALHPHKDEVTALFARNQLLRSRAARYVASAGSLLLDSRRAEACSANFEKVRRYVKRLCIRLLPRTEEMGSEELRLLSAIRARCRHWQTNASSSGTTTGQSPACCWNSSAPRRWRGATTSSPAPAPCTRRIRSTTLSSPPCGWRS